MSSKPRTALAIVGGFCLVAFLVAVVVPAAADPIHSVLTPVTCLADAPALVEGPFIVGVDVPSDTFPPPSDPARGPPLV